MNEHRFEAGHVPGEGVQAGCSCGWRDHRGYRLWAQAEKAWQTKHIDRLPKPEAEQ